MRSVLATSLLWALGLALVPLVPRAAEAQPRDRRDRSNSQFSLRQTEPGGPDASLARARARAGDCAGALPAFDVAVSKTIEPTLRRDRGLCHEKLGHPYPAIDDFRAYLAARPEANDADDIRTRLSNLEEQTGQGGPSAEAIKERESRSDSAFDEQMSGSVRYGATEHHKNEVLGPKQGEKEKTYDEYLAEERIADAAETSPLRYGSGWSIGPYLMMPRYFFDSGQTSDLAYSVGATIRYSTGSTFSIVSELGYTAIGTSGENTSAGGPLVMLGGELRIPISKYASNQLLVGAGLGFERYTVSGTKIGVDELPLRLKFGFRHVFGPKVALDLAVDGGPAYALPDSEANADNRVIGFVGGSLAFLVGF